MHSFKIGRFGIGKDQPPFIIAEMSGNHGGSLKRALSIVEAAAKTGVQALKLQTYTADTITMNCRDNKDFYIEDPKSLWKGAWLYDLYQEAHTPWEWHKPIFDRAKELGIECFSSPFDETAVDFLESLNVPAYKIASLECTHVPLIKKVASTGKPIIISTGIASIEEVELAVTTAKNAGAKDIIILKCTSSYPAKVEDANLATITDMEKRFGVFVGVSDHTMGVDVSVAACAYGAVLVEKHFIDTREKPTVDSAFSLEPDEMKKLVDNAAKAAKNPQALEAILEDKTVAELSKGEVRYGGSEAEQKSRQFRQSVIVAKDIKAGEIFTRDNLLVRRPGFGLEPKYYEELLGKVATRDLKFGQATTMDMVKEKNAA